jgi:hypothetical protein
MINMTGLYSKSRNDDPSRIVSSHIQLTNLERWKYKMNNNACQKQNVIS